MKKKRFSRGWIALLLILLLTAVPAVSAGSTAVDPYDLVLLLGNVEQTLTLLDQFTAGMTEPGSLPPAAIVRGMLQGTGWLDTSRCIALGITFVPETVPSVVVWVPFSEPKPSFASAVGAYSGEDFYCFSIPAGAPLSKGDPGIDRLQALSAEQSSLESLRLILPVERLLQTNREAIEKFLNRLETRQAGSETINPMLTPADTRTMLAAMIETAGQLDTAALAVAVDNKSIATRLDAQAVPDSRLYRLFSTSSRTARLENYQPDLPIRFRSRGYDVTTFFELMGESFGAVYEKAGLDFSDLADISGDLTGEMAGGMRYGESGPEVELVAILKKEDPDHSFVEKRYLPWLIASGEQMQKKLQLDGAPIYEKTKESRLAGHRVIGVRTQVPVVPVPAASAAGAAGPQKKMVYELRLTTVKDMLLVASNDQRLENLIAAADRFEEEPAPGHMMDVSVHLGEYLKAMTRNLPKGMASPESPLPGGVVRYHVDFEGGQARIQSKVGIRDLKEVIAYSTALAAAAQNVSTVQAGHKPSPTERVQAEVSQSPAPPPQVQATREGTAAYWADRGALCATYGNDRAAIRNYRRALKLDPQNPGYLFLLGVSLGETGNHAAAIDTIDEALQREVSPRFYYGRGRVRLMAGDRDAAALDFETAARMGHREARRVTERLAADQ